MIIGPAAVKHCGMLESHAGVFTSVADSNNVVLSSRELNPLCEGLLREGHASKGFHIKAKSCDWGPMAGMVLVEPRFSKEKDLAKQQRYINGAFEHGAGKEPVFISSLRLMELDGLGMIEQTKADGIMSKEIRIRASSKQGRSGEFMARRVGNQEPIWQLFELNGDNENPVEGLTNKIVPSAGPQPIGPRAVVARDYDLFCVWSRTYNRRPLPSGPAPVSGSVGKVYANAAKSAQWSVVDNEDANMGNVSVYSKRIIAQLNAGIISKAGYRGGNMIHHNDESGNPFTPGEDYPILFFIPGQSPKAICNPHELRAVYEECEALGFAVERNPGFRLQTFKSAKETTQQRLQRELGT